MSRRTHSTQRRRGAAALELAIALPVLLTFVLACADFGRVMHSYLVVSNAARVGAEYGSTHAFTSFTKADWQMALETRVAEELAAFNEAYADNAVINVATTTDSDGLARVRVQVTVPFQTVVSWLGLPSLVTMSPSVEMRQLQ